MGEQNLPVVGGEYVYRGVNVKVTAVRKLGRGYQVRFEQNVRDIGEVIGTARLADWAKGTQ